MKSISDVEYIKFVDYIKLNYGINLIEKKQLVLGRLTSTLIENNYKSFSGFFDQVLSDKSGKLMITLLNKITTNHTYFLREPEHFSYFTNEVLPYLVKTVSEGDLRIWSAGCSSGEEPYTLSMLLADFFGDKKMFWDTKILATDISMQVLDMATKGIYLNGNISTIPESWKLKYFKKIDDTKSVVLDRIKNEVIFRRFNLMNNEYPFRKKFHVVFCRNVLIYFDAQTKREVINKFYENTELGGYLFIGHSESLNSDGTKYKYIMPAVYRKA